MLAVCITCVISVIAVLAVCISCVTFVLAVLAVLSTFAARADVPAGPGAASSMAQVLREGLAALLPAESPVPSYCIPRPNAAPAGNPPSSPLGRVSVAPVWHFSGSN